MKVLIQVKYNSAVDKKVRHLRKEHPLAELYTDLERSPLSDIQVLLGGNVRQDLLSQLSSLKLIIVPYAGVNHLPLEYLTDHAIALSSCHSNAPYVAERALALVLDLMGRVTEYHNDLKQERWHGFSVGGGMSDAWSSLFGKTCGILGTGAIGRRLAGLLKAFDCRVTGYRRNAGETPEPFDSVSADLEEVLRESDILFVALPLTRDTHGILGEKELALLSGKILVNMGRGPLVDEKALYRVLSDGVLAGAALDAWYTYPTGRNSGAPSRFPLHQLKNVVLSPHVGGFSREALVDTMDEAFDILDVYIREGRVVNPVDTLREY